MDGVKAALVLFVAALLQLSVLTEYRLFRTASIVLVALLAIALLRGSIFGAVAGFMTGLLLDTATLGTLGITSLLLTLGGFWIGRYGETTARDRFHAPYVSVAVVTVLYLFGQLCGNLCHRELTDQQDGARRPPCIACKPGGRVIALLVVGGAADVDDAVIAAERCFLDHHAQGPCESGEASLSRVAVVEARITCAAIVGVRPRLLGERRRALLAEVELGGRCEDLFQRFGCEGILEGVENDLGVRRAAGEQQRQQNHPA